MSETIKKWLYRIGMALIFPGMLLTVVLSTFFDIFDGFCWVIYFNIAFYIVLTLCILNWFVW